MLETTVINANFVLLFFLTVFYWVQSLGFIGQRFQWVTYSGVFISQALQVSFLSIRWFTSGHFPLSNLYESILFLSWVLTFLLLVLNYQLKQNNQSTNLTTTSVVSPSIIGSVLMPVILLINTFALFSLPNELKLTTALVPALQSNWLVMHVTVMILSYGALISGSLFSMAYLVLFVLTPGLKSAWSKGSSLGSRQATAAAAYQTAKTTPNFRPGFIGNNVESLLSLLDNLSYRILALGFSLLTIGLLSGSIWANQTWGSYWSWDPKETWALITWFVFAIYLHTRFSKGWSGINSALLATFGFFILWVCYLGVNLMGKGLHSYGFLQ